jgi:hypothetical protein
MLLRHFRPNSTAGWFKDRINLTGTGNSLLETLLKWYTKNVFISGQIKLTDTLMPRDVTRSGSILGFFHDMRNTIVMKADLYTCVQVWRGCRWCTLVLLAAIPSNWSTTVRPFQAFQKSRKDSIFFNAYFLQCGWCKWMETRFYRAAGLSGLSWR